MANAYAYSSNVVIFPAINRNTNYFESARSLSENNLVNFANCGVSSFIISQSKTDTPFKFCLNGYRVTLINGLSDTTLATTSTIFASSSYATGTSILQGDSAADTSGTFNGISFTTDTGTLQILDSNGNLVLDNLYQNKIISNSDIKVDGGVIS